MTVTFAELTTMRLGGPVGEFHEARESAELVSLVRQAGDREVLIVGGGSNLVVGDQGFDGVTIRVATDAVNVDGESITADAGAVWDDVVARAMTEGLSGLESLSGIPGSVGGTPIQDVGAYGAATSAVLASLTVYDRVTDQVEQWGPERCGFGRHRHSVFKGSRRWVVLDVTYALRRSDRSRPIRYAALAEALASDIGQTAVASDVRAAVLKLRSERGMLLDAGDHDTWSVGSFFLNPVLDTVPEAARDCPSFAEPAGTKLSAAWLIEHAGFTRGYGNGRVGLSSKHTLAVTNRGGSTTAEVMAFAAHIRDGVESRFQVRLQPECDLINCELG